MNNITKNRIYNVLFLCTGNSARSIIAEAILKQLCAGKFNAFSAGSMPKGRVHPLALEILKNHKYRIDEYRSKSWEEFSGSDAPVMDILITVCNKAANEVCPIWPGNPVTMHWDIEDPDRPDLSVEEQRRLFREVFSDLDIRIRELISLHNSDN